MSRKQIKIQRRIILCQRLPCVKGAVDYTELRKQLHRSSRSESAVEGLFCVDYRFLQSLRHGKPCHLPLHKGGLVLVPLERSFVTNAWLAGQ